eukprot:165033-Hanusia_phi.AAC.5
MIDEDCTEGVERWGNTDAEPTIHTQSAPVLPCPVSFVLYHACSLTIYLSPVSSLPRSPAVAVKERAGIAGMLLSFLPDNEHGNLGAVLAFIENLNKTV